MIPTNKQTTISYGFSKIKLVMVLTNKRKNLLRWICSTVWNDQAMWI